MQFWAKTTPDDRPGISVYEHMVNVGCVARCLAESALELLNRFNLLSSLIGALAALHDLGKICPGFQRKCELWLIQNNLDQIARKGNWQGGTESDHGKASHAAIQDFLAEQGCSRGIAKHLAAALGAHHGRIKFLPSDRGIRPPLVAPLSEGRSGIDWDSERLQCARQVWNFFQVENVPSTLTGDSAAIWWFAGLTSVSDWIGSDERFFTPVAGDQKDDATECARNALDNIGLIPPQITCGLTFIQIFGFSPNDMQTKAMESITGPGVYVIEAPMGMGKTEAAFGAAYHLLTSGKARGIYFALPTQATSNRIHLRMNEFLSLIAPMAGNSRLIHGNSWLMRDDLDDFKPAHNASEKPDQDARSGRDWFASAKRALLAPFGVGTVDQALLGVVAAKHFFVRHFALAGKVVIIDEVHSYDVYTGALIEKLITTLEGLGCTVIILSATLTGKRRAQLLSDTEKTDEPAIQPYPLLSGRTEKVPLQPVSATPPSSKKVMVAFVKPDKALEEAIAVACAGGAVLWICNTVGAAQQQFRRLQKHAADRFKLGLLHSRMIFTHREDREEEWMKRFGKDGASRCGSILVSTQVVEQSVDLDADLLVTELAPTDMLLQRLGRLWRHARAGRPVNYPRVCILEEEKSLEELQDMPPKAIIAALGKKACVYAPFVLLRTLEVWRAQTDGVSIPGQIRELLELTYCDRVHEPASWLTLYTEWFGTDSAKKLKAQMSTNFWQPPLDDQEGIQTRYNELQTISLILCKELTRDKALFVDGTAATISGEFSYETARAIHRNLVKTPQHHFSILTDKGLFSDYLYEQHAVGIVSDDGVVAIDGLKIKENIGLSYSAEIGLVVEKSK